MKSVQGLQTTCKIQISLGIKMFNDWEKYDLAHKRVSPLELWMLLADVIIREP
jgi:hypothetical protein